MKNSLVPFFMALRKFVLMIDVASPDYDVFNGSYWSIQFVRGAKAFGGYFTVVPLKRVVFARFDGVKVVYLIDGPDHAIMPETLLLIHTMTRLAHHRALCGLRPNHYVFDMRANRYFYGVLLVNIPIRGAGLYTEKLVQECLMKSRRTHKN